MLAVEKFSFFSGEMVTKGSTRSLPKKRHNILYNKYLKRILDVFFSGLAILLFFPFMLVMVAAIYIDDPKGNPIFIQTRVGRHGHVFKCYKFRSMYGEAPRDCATCNLINAEKYITRMGRLLRKTSLDELPQLVNILKGDMSFIGPRPLVLPEKDIHILRYQNGVYAVRPGITGLAQINGRDKVPSDLKLKYDIEYVSTLSFKHDYKILCRTLSYVLKSEDIVEGVREPDKRRRVDGGKVDETNAY